MDRYAWAKICGGSLLFVFAQMMVHRLDANVRSACASCANLDSYVALQRLSETGAFLPLIVVWTTIVEHFQRRSKPS